MTDQEARDGLGLVHMVVRQRYPRGHPPYDHDELVAMGALGLLAAHRRFDPSRGFTFPTFAVPRIRGAIADAIRSQGFVPRKAHARLGRARKRQETLAKQLGRWPSWNETAASLGDDPDKLQVVRVAMADHLSLADPLYPENPGSPTYADTMEDRAAPSALDEVLSADHSREVQERIDRLPEREQFVVRLRCEDMTLREIGASLGVTESRVCQILASAIESLRADLEAEPLAA